MGWLRIHDGFTANSKIAELNDGEFRVWMRLLCHCANSRDPSVDRVAKREISGLNSRRIRRFADLGLLDEIGSDFEVHDWSKYMPKEEQNAARQAKWRARRRNAERNGTSNAGSNAEVTPQPSRARAGTRGVPSRPVPYVDPGAVPEPRLAGAPEPDLNSHGDLSIRETIADSLASARAAGGQR